MPMFQRAKQVVNEICNWHSANSDVSELDTAELLTLLREDITEVDIDDVPGSLVDWYRDCPEPNCQHLGSKVRG